MYTAGCSAVWIESIEELLLVDGEKLKHVPCSGARLSVRVLVIGLWKCWLALLLLSLPY